MFRRNETNSKSRYLIAFVWLCVCTFLFAFISPSIQYISHAAARIVGGTQKIFYAKALQAEQDCTFGTKAKVAIPYDSSPSQRSVLVFENNVVPSITETTYVYNQNEDSVIGKAEKIGAVVSLVPFFSSTATVQAYAGESLITLTGKGNGTYIAEVPKQTEIVLGEPISIALAGHLKKIGTVVAVHDTPQSPIKTVTVRSLIAPSALQSVCVITL